jgi:hypothetical protein
MAWPMRAAAFLISSSTDMAFTECTKGQYPLYFNCVEIDENVVLSFVPTFLTVAMMTNAMPAAIKPYSIDVTACLARRKVRILLSIRS